MTCYYMYGEDTLDSLIYPRLRLKSEVISNCVDGKNCSTFDLKDETNFDEIKSEPQDEETHKEEEYADEVE